MRHHLLLTLALLSLSACQRTSPVSPGPAEPAAVPSPAPAPQEATAGAASRSPEVQIPPVLALQLSQEAAARPAVTPRAEDVLAALRDAGMQLGAPRQYLASGVDARYCLGASSSAGLTLSVCEYADVKAAQAGRKKSLAIARTPDREVLLNRTTTLSVLQLPRSPTTEAEARVVADVFRKL